MEAIVYRTENKINGRFYYGVHTISDRTKYYLGSGKILKQAIDKYGADNFVRRTIKRFDSIEEAYKFEELMVDQLLIDNPLCYNIQPGGFGGQSEILKEIAKSRPPMSESTRNKISKANIGNSKRSKPTTIDGVTYSSRIEAANSLGVTYVTILNRLKKTIENE